MSSKETIMKSAQVMLLSAIIAVTASSAFADNRPLWDEQRDGPIDFLSHAQPDKFPQVSAIRPPIPATARRVKPTFDDASFKALSEGIVVPDLAARPANN